MKEGGRKGWGKGVPSRGGLGMSLAQPSLLRSKSACAEGAGGETGEAGGAGEMEFLVGLG